MPRILLPPPKPTGFLEQIVGVSRGRRIALYDSDVVIGRSKGAYVCSQDPNVSRNHCSLKYKPNGWSIKDLGSVNGTYVDDVRIPTNSYVPLQHGCSIYFGPSEDAPEGYRFETAMVTKENNTDNELRRSSRIKTPSPQKSTLERASKRKASPTHASASYLKRSEQNCCTVLNEKINFFTSKIKRENCAEDGYHSDSSISSLDSLKTRIRKVESAEKRKSKKVKLNNSEDNLNFPSTSTAKPFEVGLSQDGRSCQVTNSLVEDSESLLNRDLFLDWDIDDFSDNKKQLGKNNSPTKKVTHSPDMGSHSVAVQSNLLSVLQKKVNDLQKTLKTLNSKFSETMNENEKLLEVLKTKEKAELTIKEDFKKLLEEEMICNICTEIFIKPITLGCSHTYCQYCIFEWKKKKKQCPMCREKIETETTVLFMDNFITKAVEQLDQLSLVKRQELIKKREEEMLKKKPKRKGSKRAGRRRTTPSVPDLDEDDEVEILRSRISEIQSYTDDIQTYVDVIDELINEQYSDNDVNSYYDGYNRCYNCGRHGHWANSCPY